jgi:tetraacyldisaccharide 4'-kinase
MRINTAALVEEIWYGRSPLAWPLLPVSWLYRAFTGVRRAAYATGLLGVFDPGVPLVIVGNISVGGTGKTPLVIWLARFFKERGFRPGIVARGSAGAVTKWPQQVRPDSDPFTVGDEAVVMARRTACPVAVYANRPAAVAALLKHADCNLVLSDDGLQHYALGRTLEIAVVDGIRRFGNGHCLPAGPLREPPSRLGSVDMVVTHGLAARGEFPMSYRAEKACSLIDPMAVQALSQFKPREVHAVAGIGHAEQFFAMLRARGFRVTPHAFPDHHRFVSGDLAFAGGETVLMTEKDAVKCEHFAQPSWWYVPIEAELPAVFARRLEQLMERTKSGQTPA